MLKKNALIALFIFSASINLNAQELQSLLNQQFLRNKDKVQDILTKQGFQKIYFKTQDNVNICGLFLDQSNKGPIKGTIIYCAGFYPGTKEGMTSFYALFANQPYNFLLFDARGHQESEGSLFSYSSLKQYGSCEYQDIISAINFLHEYNTQKNINPSVIIHGICCGAFHSIKALHHLQSTNCPQCYNVKGIIFDSGWLNLTDIVEPACCTEIKNKLKDSYFSWLTRPLCWFFKKFYHYTLKKSHVQISGISLLIPEIKAPIFFVHCTNDPYAPITPVQQLVTQHQYPHVWWINHDSHATYHIAQQKVYQEKINNFCSKVLI